MTDHDRHRDKFLHRTATALGERVALVATTLHRDRTTRASDLGRLSCAPIRCG
jgi:hypothetical protein